MRVQGATNGILGIAVAGWACSAEPAPRAPIAASTADVAPVAPVASTPVEPAPPVVGPSAVTTMKGAKPGAAIVLRGRPSKIVWQHMMSSVPGKHHAYFDLEGGKEQTVVYWASPVTCPGDVEVTGKVLALRGSPKRPGAQESKVDDSYSELHVDVDSARCAP